MAVTGVESEDGLRIKWCDRWNNSEVGQACDNWWLMSSCKCGQTNGQSPSSWKKTDYQLIHFRNRKVKEKLLDENWRGVLW